MGGYPGVYARMYLGGYPGVYARVYLPSMPPYTTLGIYHPMYTSFPIPPWVHLPYYRPLRTPSTSAPATSLSDDDALGSKTEKGLGESLLRA